MAPEQMIHAAKWQEDGDNKRFDLRIEQTQGGSIKLANLSDPSYEQTFSSLDQAVEAFEKLMRQGTGA